jgi:hypothetical protein
MSRSGIDTDRQFVALSAISAPATRLDFSAFVVGQQIAGNTDRRAVGFETLLRQAALRCCWSTMTSFQAINSAI